MIPGFEEGIVGHKAGEQFDINVTFPAEYHSENLKVKMQICDHLEKSRRNGITRIN